MNFSKAYYSILGIQEQASKDEIKAAYRLMAMQHHPDRNPGDEGAPDRFRDVHEAYEILSDDNTRFTYDTYWMAARKSSAEGQETVKATLTKQKPKNVRTVTRKRYVKTERKIYVKGIIRVKYWGEPEIQGGRFTAGMTYRIHPTNVEAFIQETDIFPYQLNTADVQVFDEAVLFLTPIIQPVCCIIKTVAGEERYMLHLNELKIIDPVLRDITKYEEQSLGTLEAVFYAYVQYTTEEEVTETVIDSSGPTGREEEQTVDGTTYKRQEYYHADGNRFWTKWVVKQSTPEQTSKSYSNATAAQPFRKTEQVTPMDETNGCAVMVLAITIIMGALYLPKVFLPIIIIVAIWSFCIALASFSARSFGLLLAAVFFGGLMFAYSHGSKNIMYMRSFFDLQILFPIGFILLWILSAIYAGGWILKKAGIARIPIGGIEYSESVVSGSLILGMLLICTAAVGPLFDYYHSISQTGIFPVSTFVRLLGRYSFVIALFSVFFILLSILAAKYLPGVKQPLKEVKSGNVPLAVVLGMVAVGMAIVLRIVASRVMQEMITI